jgi:FkbM family methyltransferase
MEPIAVHHEALLRERPRDVNLAVAAGPSDGEISLFDVPSVVGWASVDDRVASAHQADGFPVTEVRVPMRTLSSVCQEFAPSDIHFLKIDVEGFEEEVLRGMDFTRWRPWVVLVEATRPNSRVTNHDSWEQLLTGRDYHFAHFDGLNRFYVANEHRTLLDVLNVQANVFDDFLSFHLVKAWESTTASVQRERDLQIRVVELDAQVLQSRGKESEALQLVDLAKRETMEAIFARNGVETENAALKAEANGLAKAMEVQTEEGRKLAAWAVELEQQILSIHGSLSWRMTYPIRWFTGVLDRRWSFQEFLGNGIRRLISHQGLRSFLIPLIRRVPILDRQVNRFSSRFAEPRAETPMCSPQSVLPTHLKNLSERARHVYADLSRAMSDTGVK